MRNYALPITVSTLVMGIFGAFLRWLQIMGIYEAETGLTRPMAPISVVLVIYSLLVLAAAAGIALLLGRKLEQSPEAETALAARTGIPAVVGGIAALLLLASSLQLLFSAGNAHSPMLQRILGASGVVAAASLFCLPSRKGGGFLHLAPTASLYLPLFLCYWMVCCYKNNAEDPVLWNYVVYILAIGFNALAFYHLSSWFFRRAKSFSALVCIQYAVYLDMASLSDQRSAWIKAMLVACGGLLLCTEYLLIRNMKEKEAAA